jgi:hypothetical protein
VVECTALEMRHRCKPIGGSNPSLSATKLFVLCIRLFDSAGKATSSATKDVAASSAMLPIVTARPVGFGRGFGGRFAKGKHMAGKLRPLDVERETRPGKYFDGDGLYLVVKGATSRNWIYRYRKDGRERWLGLGSLKDVSLKNARMARDAARPRVKGDRSAAGVDIVQEKRAAREEAKATKIKVTLPTFEECAETYIREHWPTWSKKHRNQWPSSLKRYAYPTIGKLTIPEIKPSHIYELLRPIWVEKRETANRGPRTDRNDHREERRCSRHRFSKSCRAHQTAAREASKAAETRRAASSGAALC